MECAGCGRRLKSKKSQKLGYGPVCYRKMFKKSKVYSSIDDFPYYDIPGQMSIEDYLESENGKEHE